MMLSFLTYWREIALALMAVALFSVYSIYSGKIEKRDSTIATLTAEASLNDLQKEALRKAITDQSEAVEAHRIDAEKRAAQFEIKTKEIWKQYEAKRKEVQSLSGDAECQAMRSMIREAVQ